MRGVSLLVPGDRRGVVWVVGGPAAKVVGGVAAKVVGGAVIWVIGDAVV